MRVRVLGELNDFLPRDRRGRTWAIELHRRASLKDVLESLGVPHTEIGDLMLDGTFVELDTVVDAGSTARIIARPEGAGAASDLRPPILLPYRFVADVHLGALTRRLRLAGFDVIYANDAKTPALARLAAEQQRILLTRDRRLLKRAQVVHARFVRADAVDAQFDDIRRHFMLDAHMQPFTRCSDCNTPLESVAKAEIVHRLEPLTRAHFSRFARCPGCDKLYWGGSHVANVRRRLAGSR